jgi:hypothetical protein
MWMTVQSQADVDQLMQVFRSFHDSCIKEVAIQNREFVDENLAMHFDNRTFVRMLFQSQFAKASALEIQFEDVVVFNWVQDERNLDTRLSVIFQAVCQWNADTLYWAEDLDWALDSPDKNDYRWVAAKRARWRIVDALGPATYLGIGA